MQRRKFLALGAAAAVAPVLPAAPVFNGASLMALIESIPRPVSLDPVLYNWTRVYWLSGAGFMTEVVDPREVVEIVNAL